MRIGIIGGGPGGLMTAYLLDRKSQVRLRTKIFEASGRLGGKLVTAQFDCAPVRYEAGAAELYGYSQIGPDPLHILIKNLGLATKDMFGGTVVLDNQILGSPADIKRHLGTKTLTAIQEFHKRGRKSIGRRFYYDSGWPDDNKHPWRRRSFQSLLAEVPDKQARRYLKVAVHSDLATEPAHTSALFGVQNALIDHKDYVRLYALEGGMEQLTRALGKNTTAQIALNSPVVRVKKNSFGTYNIYYRQGDRIFSEEFDAVVVALPNAWLPIIDWEGRRLEEAICKHQLYYEGMAHYLRICLLFQKPFWRELICGSYFQSDAFGGCCLYDESSKLDAGGYGTLSWLLAGSEALLRSNLEDRALIAQALDSLPPALSAGRELLLEGKVHRWAGAVSAPRVGHRIQGAKRRHSPDPKGHAGLLVVGDYLFDTTLNGVLDSADIATNLALRHLGVKMRAFSLEAPRLDWQTGNGATLKKSYFVHYDGSNDYKSAFKVYFDHEYIIKLIKLVWGTIPPYRLLDSGSASGLSIMAFAKSKVDTWGIENNHFIYSKTPLHLRTKNVLADVRDIPFEDNFFDFVYDTSLCYVPECDLDRSIRELRRVARYGVLHGSVTKDVKPSVAVKDDMNYGIQTLATLSEWSERFRRNGFRLAVTDKTVLRRIWKLENDEGDGDVWYPNRQAMKYVFYTKDITIDSIFSMPRAYGVERTVTGASLEPLESIR
jgi:monoamine oxidase/ubiquinone/menaquinone biosynthesis C-methylase UbiE